MALIEPVTIGWREWVRLPDLGIPLVKAKIDTGAKTSALHAFELETFENENGVETVRFLIHPIRKRDDIVIQCEAPVFERRTVRDSGGHAEERVVIETPICLGEISIVSQVTLTSRDDMLFRMLVGRRTIQSARAMVSVNDSYLLGKVRESDYDNYYPRTEQITGD